MNPYNFEQLNPPVLTEAMLREKAAHRWDRLILALLVLAGVLMQTSIVVLGLWTERLYPVFSSCCFFYVFFSTVVCILFAGLFSYKGGFARCSLPQM